MNIIGWKERVDFPDWELAGMKAKIDTGARTAALGVLKAEMANGQVIFEFAPFRRRPSHIVKARASLAGLATVKSSTGIAERRPVIHASIRLGDVEWRVRLTLADRRSMLIPLLLGRTSLAGHFVVDPSLKYCQERLRS